MLRLASGHFPTQTARRDSLLVVGVTPTGNREAGKFAADTTQLPTGCQPESLAHRHIGRHSSGAKLAKGRSLPFVHRPPNFRYAYRFAGLASPTDDEVVKATVRGIRRTLGTAKMKKAPATAERLLAMAANTDAGLRGLRDRALLLIGSQQDRPGRRGPNHRRSVWQDRLPRRRA
jgi:hypothetical protein